MSEAQVTIIREIVPDDDADISWLEQEGFEQDLAAYQAGVFGFVGVRAVAEIRIPYGHDWIVTTLKSPGLWGIQDNSGDDYYQEVFEEERQTLLDMLVSLRNFELVG
jgi:hypothetical protein